VPPPQQQVIVVEDVARELRVDVRREQPAQLTGVLAAPRIRAVEHGLERRARVDRARIDREAGVLAREPPVLLRQPAIAADQIEQVGRIAAIEHGERRVEAER
jgi:hypothetical protein